MVVARVGGGLVVSLNAHNAVETVATAADGEVVELNVGVIEGDVHAREAVLSHGERVIVRYRRVIDWGHGDVDRA